ncbi:MAG: hypothetical protein JSU73_14210 [candidate division WOR-3 bacterium]|nr:MAG: hypothetical protein JSU73_14210 [candidate division WOR-3 bacterium]
MWLATARESDTLTGRRYMGRKELEIAEKARDPDLARRLPEVGQRSTGLWRHGLGRATSG